MTERFAGLDVTMKATTTCVADGGGQVIFEGSAVTDPVWGSPRLLRLAGSAAAGYSLT